MLRRARSSGNFKRESSPEQQAIAVCSPILAVQHSLEGAGIMLGVSAGKAPSASK